MDMDLDAEKLFNGYLQIASLIYGFISDDYEDMSQLDLIEKIHEITMNQLEGEI